MADVTAKLAKALRGLLADRIYEFDFKEAEKVLAEYDAAKAQPVQDLPPLPIEWRKVEDAEGVEVPVFRAFQMRDYARAALAATPAPAPLTDEQIAAIWRDLRWSLNIDVEAVRAIERACAEAWGVKLAGQGKEASNV